MHVSQDRRYAALGTWGYGLNLYHLEAHFQLDDLLRTGATCTLWIPYLAPLMCFLQILL